MSPEREGGNGQGDEGQRPDETQEFNVGDELRGEQEQANEEPAREEEPRDEKPSDEEPRDEGPEDEKEVEERDPEEAEGEDEPDDKDPEEEEGDQVDEEPELSEEERLAQLVSAPTQEWEGLEAAEATADEPTVIQKAGSAITSSFEKVGSATTSGFRVVREHVRFPVWLRFLTASFVIVASVAGATSASLILYLSDIANALRNHSAIEGVDPFLTRTTSSGPQTIMIIGSDKRNQEISGKFGLSDTTMLLRLDPDRDAIALLSLPRDLKVDIPGVGTDKLNAAYSFGGPKLTLRTVKQLTGLQINHLVNVDFTGFARAVNAIGCVYVDVDHRYYHQNGPYASSSDYAEINLQPGYQALCGFDALSFVRYRHTDNDIVRSARQQAFLREARAKVPPERLIEDRKKLVKIFTTYTSSDIGSAEEMLRVLRLFFDLRGAQIKEIHFQGQLGPSYVTASADEIHTAVNQFLGSESTPGPQGSTAKPDQKVVPRRHRTPPSRSRPPRSTRRPLPRTWSGRATGSHWPRGSRRGSSRSRSTTRPSSRWAATTHRSRAPTRSTARGTSRRPTPRGRRTSGSSRFPRSGTTTASWEPVGRTRPFSTTPPTRRRSGTVTTSSSTTGTGCGWSPGRPTRARSGSRTLTSRPSRTRTC